MILRIDSRDLISLTVAILAILVVSFLSVEFLVPHVNVYVFPFITLPAELVTGLVTYCVMKHLLNKGQK